MHNHNTISISHFHNIKSVYGNRAKHLRASVEAITLDGVIVECGVFRGKSINRIAKWTEQRKIIGFDTFTGLPEKWVRTKAGESLGVGRYKCRGIPNVAVNVELIKGLFINTLPTWADKNKEPIAFLHIDSDLYSSAIQVLTILNKFIVPGTVIVFDELCNFEDSEWNYDNWEQGEWRALLEWMKVCKREIVGLLRSSHEQASIRVVV